MRYNLHLAEVSTQVAPGACAVLLCDRAGWQQPGGDLRLPDNIRLLHLPSYSPELNPMENVWDYLRRNKLCATVWDAYDDIVQACKVAWNWLIADPPRISSIGTRNWAAVNVWDGRYNIAHNCARRSRVSPISVRYYPREADLLRRLNRRATKLGVDHVETTTRSGHLKVRHDGKATVVPMHRGDLPMGTYRAITKQLGLTERDIEG